MLLKGYLSFFAGGFSLHLLNHIDTVLHKFHWTSCQAHQLETIGTYINFRFHYMERKTYYFQILTCCTYCDMHTLQSRAPKSCLSLASQHCFFLNFGRPFMCACLCFLLSLVIAALLPYLF